MKNILAALILLGSISIACAQDAQWILQKMDDIRDYKTTKMDATMRIIDKKGIETVLEEIRARGEKV